MLTVKKFGGFLDLSFGGYIASLIGLIIATLTILVFPPDIDLAGEFSIQLSSFHLSLTIRQLYQFVQMM